MPMNKPNQLVAIFEDGYREILEDFNASLNSESGAAEWLDRLDKAHEIHGKIILQYLT